jgi:hypothetical protein
MVNLGSIYERGELGKIDLNMAMHYFQLAVNANYAAAVPKRDRVLDKINKVMLVHCNTAFTVAALLTSQGPFAFRVLVAFGVILLGVFYSQWQRSTQ